MLSNRSATDAVFVSMCFVDLKKSFDRVILSNAIIIPQKQGTPPELIQIIQNLYPSRTISVQAETGQTIEKRTTGIR